MALFLLLLARMLSANGVPAVVCDGHLVIGDHCRTEVSLPPASPPPPEDDSEGELRATEWSPKSISNGF